MAKPGRTGGAAARGGRSGAARGRVGGGGAVRGGRGTGSAPAGRVGGASRSATGGAARSGGAPRAGAGGAAGARRTGGGGGGGGQRAGGRQSVVTTGFKDRERGLGGEQVEGRQAVRELLIAGTRRVREIWIAGDIDQADIIDDIRDLAADQRVPILEVSRRKLDAEARSEAPQGILAKAASINEADFGVVLRGTANRKPFLVAVDGVTDPGNLGALLRCADGAGVTGIILPKHRAVHVTPTVAKSAAGAIEHVPMVLAPGLPTALRQVKEAGIWVVGLDDDADRSLFDLGQLTTEGICLVLGAEGPGLSKLVRERCDMIVSIPMLGRLSSLNVSTAAALAFYEVTRHRV